MEVYQDGVRVNVLPDCAVCKADERRRSPMDIDVCPCGYEICTDCYYYGEDWKGENAGIRGDSESEPYRPERSEGE